jgi:hypothetical protein
MKTVIDYLNDLKGKLGSDYKSAKALNFETSTISTIRKRGQISDETAVKIAELLEIDPGEVLIAAAMARSQGAVKAAWEGVGKKAGLAASLVMAMMMGATYPTDVRANSNGVSMYIMLNCLLLPTTRLEPPPYYAAPLKCWNGVVQFNPQFPSKDIYP